MSPSFTETSAKAVETAEAAVATATEPAAVERARGGCKDLCRQREAEERAAREALLKVQQNHVATVKAADLDGKIAAAEHALSQVGGPNVEIDREAAVRLRRVGTYAPHERFSHRDGVDLRGLVVVAAEVHPSVAIPNRITAVIIASVAANEEDLATMKSVSHDVPVHDMPIEAGTVPGTRHCPEADGTGLSGVHAPDMAA